MNRDLHMSLLYKFLHKTEKCGFIELVQLYGKKLEYDSTLTLFGITCGPMRPTLTILANCMKTTGSIGLKFPDFS